MITKAGLAAMLTVACWASDETVVTGNAEKGVDSLRFPNDDQSQPGDTASNVTKEGEEEREDKSSLDHAGSTESWGCYDWSCCTIWGVGLLGVVAIIVLAVHSVTAPPSFAHIFTERYPGMFSTDVTLPDFLCKSEGSLEKSAPELMTQEERDLCSTTHDRNFLNLGRESHVQPWLENATEIPLNVEIDSGVNYLQTPEDQAAFRQHVLGVTQVAGDVIGKTYRLVNDAECKDIGAVQEWQVGKDKAVTPCQKLKYTKYDWDGDYFRLGFFDPITTYECIVNPHVGGSTIDESPYRDEITLHEMIHSQGVSHSMIEGALMKVGGHGRGAVLDTNDINRLTATYAKTDIAARRAAAAA